MTHPVYSFKIPDKVVVHVDLGRKLAVITCKTDDGKSLRLEVAYQTVNRIHDELRKQTQGY